MHVERMWENFPLFQWDLDSPKQGQFLRHALIGIAQFIGDNGRMGSRSTGKSVYRSHPSTSLSYAEGARNAYLLPFPWCLVHIETMVNPFFDTKSLRFSGALETRMTTVVVLSSARSNIHVRFLVQRSPLKQ